MKFISNGKVDDQNNNNNDTNIWGSSRYAYAYVNSKTWTPSKKSTNDISI